MKIKLRKKMLKLLAGGAVISLLPFSSFSLISSTNDIGNEKVKAATTSSGTLVPGQSFDTGNHFFVPGDLTNLDNWNIVEKNTSGSFWSNNWINMKTNGKNRGVWSVFDSALDMRGPVSFSAGQKAKQYTLGIPNLTLGKDLGDGLGLILSPLAASEISNGGTGPGLGISGLPNTVFIGRDFYYNSDRDSKVGKDFIGNLSTQARIVKTDINGIMPKSGESTVGPNPVGDAKDLPIGGETLTIEWNNLTPLPDDKVRGDLQVSIGKTNLTYPQLELDNFMSLAVLGITGGNYSEFSYNLNSDNFDSFKGINNVVVNYIDRRTGESLAEPSIITGSIGDVIGVMNPKSTTPSVITDYEYTAPKIDKYEITSISNPVKIENGKLHSIDVNYGEVKDATFKNYYIKDTPGTGTVKDNVTELEGGNPNSNNNKQPGQAIALEEPSPSVISGPFGEPISEVPEIRIPKGYSLDYIVAPDGKDGTRYTDLKTAILNNPYGDTRDNSWANNFSLYFKADEVQSNFVYKYVPETGEDAPQLPEIPSLTGVTGGVIPNPSEDLPTLPPGVKIENVLGPDGETYNDLSSALEKNKFYTGPSVDFVLNVVKGPIVPTLDTVPDYNFEDQTLKGAGATYETLTKIPLQVTDNSNTNNGWSVTAAMEQQFMLDASGNNKVAEMGSVLNGASLEFIPDKIKTTSNNTATPPEYSKFTLLENGASVKVINAKESTGQGQWSLNFSKVILNPNGAPISAGKTYSSTIKWSLNDVPL